MKQKSVAVVGAAETTKMGKIPDVSSSAGSSSSAVPRSSSRSDKPSKRVDGASAVSLSVR